MSTILIFEAGERLAFAKFIFDIRRK